MKFLDDLNSSFLHFLIATSSSSVHEMATQKLKIPEVPNHCLFSLRIVKTQTAIMSDSTHKWISMLPEFERKYVKEYSLEKKKCCQVVYCTCRSHLFYQHLNQYRFMPYLFELTPTLISFSWGVVEAEKGYP